MFKTNQNKTTGKGKSAWYSYEEKSHMLVLNHGIEAIKNRQIDKRENRTISWFVCEVSLKVKKYIFKRDTEREREGERERGRERKGEREKKKRYAPGIFKSPFCDISNRNLFYQKLSLLFQHRIQKFSLVWFSVLFRTRIIFFIAFSSIFATNMTTKTILNSLIFIKIFTIYISLALSSPLTLDSSNFRSVFLPVILSNFHQTHNLTSKCHESLLSESIGIDKGQLESIKMFNSWGEFPPKGFVLGTLTDLGSYDQCLSISSSQYCLLETTIPLPAREEDCISLFHEISGVLPEALRLDGNKTFQKHLSNNAVLFYHTNIQTGICLPSICTHNDVQQIGTLCKFFFTLTLF